MVLTMGTPSEGESCLKQGEHEGSVLERWHLMATRKDPVQVMRSGILSLDRSPESGEQARHQT